MPFRAILLLPVKKGQQSLAVLFRYEATVTDLIKQLILSLQRQKTKLK
jgi:hypothetical protein